MGKNVHNWGAYRNGEPLQNKWAKNCAVKVEKVNASVMAVTVVRWEAHFYPRCKHTQDKCSEKHRCSSKVTGAASSSGGGFFLIILISAGQSKSPVLYPTVDEETRAFTVLCLHKIFAHGSFMVESNNNLDHVTHYNWCYYSTFLLQLYPVVVGLQNYYNILDGSQHLCNIVKSLSVSRVGCKQMHKKYIPIFRS